MKVQIRVLREAPTLVARLKRSGWTVEVAADGSMLAHHREVSTAAQARAQLHRLGLLTATGLLIDFAVVKPR
jgi:hypothetical protein